MFDTQIPYCHSQLALKLSGYCQTYVRYYHVTTNTVMYYHATIKVLSCYYQITIRYYSDTIKLPECIVNL